jgi:hypothetical protein
VSTVVAITRARDLLKALISGTFVTAAGAIGGRGIVAETKSLTTEYVLPVLVFVALKLRPRHKYSEITVEPLRSRPDNLGGRHVLLVKWCHL